MAQTVIFDLDDEFIWDSITDTRGSDGNLTERKIIFDDGLNKTWEHLPSGVTSKITLIDGSVVGDAYSWQSLVYTFNENGDLVFSDTLGDNEVRSTVAYENGEITEKNEYDQSADGAGHDWTTRKYSYDANSVVAKLEVAYDNGVQFVANYTTGLISDSLFTDSSVGGTAKIWQSISTSFVNGIKSVEMIVFDNAVERETKYTAGVKRTVTQNDYSTDGAAHSWQYVVVDYHTNGRVASREILYDNGIEAINTWDTGGAKKTISLKDTSDVALWESQTTTVDSGWIIRTVTYDTGVRSLSAFAQTSEGNILSETLWTDASTGGLAHDWQTIEFVFNWEDGSVAGKNVVYDNGISHSFVQLDSGELVISFSSDQSDGGLAMQWSTKQYYYFDDKLEMISTNFDNGSYSTKEFFADGSAYTYHDDTSFSGAAYAWRYLTETHDTNGKIASRGIQYDNGDLQGAIFEDGLLSRVLRIDYSDSHDWYAVEFVYDENGILIDEIYYDPADDFPNIYENTLTDFIW
jgi:antitoxin component YwqK of YwqJK toxin-antitoxin module